MKGEIVCIRKMVNEAEITLGYQVTIECDSKPNLILGECEVHNK